MSVKFKLKAFYFSYKIS